MTAASRKTRAAATQAEGAAWFRGHGFPFATDAGAGRQGRDILNLVGLACEVKARADLQPRAWVRQAQTNADGDLPFVLFRCNGQGPASIADWPVLLRLEDFTALVRAAGYGDPEPHGWCGVKRQAELQREWWDRTVTEVRGRLARIDRGETSAPPSVVRCLRVFVSSEVRR